MEFILNNRETLRLTGNPEALMITGIGKYKGITRSYKEFLSCNIAQTFNKQINQQTTKNTNCITTENLFFCEKSFQLSESIRSCYADAKLKVF